jgi:hypothetical protein
MIKDTYYILRDCSEVILWKPCTDIMVYMTKYNWEAGRNDKVNKLPAK